MVRMSKRNNAAKIGGNGNHWVRMAVGTAVFALLLGNSRAKWGILDFLGLGAWLVGPSMILVSILGITGRRKQKIALWRNRLILSVPLLSLIAASVEGVFTGHCRSGGLVGGFIPLLLVDFVGGLSYWICSGIGFGLIYMALLRPILRQWNLELSSVPEIISGVFQSSHDEPDGKGGRTIASATTPVDQGGAPQPGAPRQMNESVPIGNRERPNGRMQRNPANRPSGAGDDSGLLDDNEEMFFDVLPEPTPNAALGIEILPDSPPSARMPVSPEALKKLRAIIQDAARSLARIDLEPSGEPIVGMTSIRFAFDKAAGQSVSVTKALDLADDLGVETDRAPVRIYITSTINFEFPLTDEERQFVPIKSLLADAPKSAADENDVKYLIGRHQDGRVFELSAHSALHMLVGGSTGGGKSVLLHTIIAGLVFRYAPSKVRIALYDHKIEEFAPYQGLPHLWQSVVTNEGGYHRLIQNLKGEIKRRKLARRDNPDAQLYWLIVIMDEFRGLSNDSFVALIAEARSLQIRFILGTQRAEKSFISTSIKANLPTGISFRVRNQMESRLIIGEPDACNLLPHGDCIVHSPSEMERIQAGWVQKDDLKAIRAQLKRMADSPSSSKRA